MKKTNLKKLCDEWIIETTIDEIQQIMSAGDLTSTDLVQMYLHRIAVFDSKIHSVVEINPDAIHIASSLDTERIKSGSRGMLHGIPILIKDSIDTGDKMHTSAGSLALANYKSEQDAFVVEKLRKAGAVLLGKTNMMEWAHFMSLEMPSGYSSKGEQTLNPYGPRKFDVGDGSSVGSGAAISSNLATASIGTETSGSILTPSLKNSLVGIKPTVGLISRQGVIPISHSQDTVGPMARTVKDAAYLLSEMVGFDEKDSVTLTLPRNKIDYATDLRQTDLVEFRIGIAGEPFTSSLCKNEIKMLKRVKSSLKTLGATLVDHVDIPSAQKGWDYKDYSVQLYEFKAGINAYLHFTHSSNPIRSLADVIQFNEDNPDEMLKYGQNLLLQSQETSGRLIEPEYVFSLERDRWLSRERGIDYALKEYKLDAIVFSGDRGREIAALAGYPTVIVPAGFYPSGEPYGISFTGTAFCEETLLKIAYTFEQFTNHRMPPKLY